MRISIDNKAKVKIGNLLRGGKARTLNAQAADDHDHQWQALLVPFGILNTQTDQLSIYLGQSAETSDFIVDCLEAWWRDHQADYLELEELAIGLDGGPANRSDRIQFIKRMVTFSEANRLSIPVDLLPALP